MRLSVLVTSAVLVAAALGIGVVTPAAATEPPLGPPGDAFYQPPAQLPPRAGDVIWYRPSTFYLAPLIKSSAKAWQVLYRSTAATGGATAVSGTVLVPSSRWTGPGPRPIVSFSPGTTGMDDRCAVSNAIDGGFDTVLSSYETAIMTQVLGRGWAVAITDYQGLGTPGEHPYVVGKA